MGVLPLPLTTDCETLHILESRNTWVGDGHWLTVRHSGVIIWGLRVYIHFGLENVVAARTLSCFPNNGPGTTMAK